MLSKIARLLRKIPLYARIERAVWRLPQPYSAILTALFHGAATALSGPFAPLVATLYTIRELRAVRDKGYTAPEYDHVSDIVLPWLVVAAYAALAALLFC